MAPLRTSEKRLSILPDLLNDNLEILQNYTGALNGGVYKTDLTNASRTLVLSLHTLDWSDELLDFFGIPRSCLPEIVTNSEVYGNFYEGHLLAGLPIASLIGDQQAALVGNKCLSRGEAKQTYGLFCFFQSSLLVCRPTNTCYLLLGTGCFMY